MDSDLSTDFTANQPTEIETMTNLVTQQVLKANTTMMVKKQIDFILKD